jgi:hypothetical protein
MPARKFDGLARQACMDAGEWPGVAFAMSARVTRFAYLVALLAGCTSPNATLADLPNLRVGVIVDEELDSDGDDTSRPSTVQIGLYYDETTFRREHGECATLDEDDISGTVNGDVKLRVASAGDRDKEIDECNPPYLRTPTFVLGIHEMGRVEFRDSSLAISAEFPAAVFGPRMASAPSWNLVAGQPFAFTWSHPEDLVGVTPDRVSVSFPHGNYVLGEDFTVTEVTATEIRGVVPAAPEYTGSGAVQILIFDASEWTPATSCVGAAECNATSYRIYKHTAELAP